jgi:hypothetical protein
VLIAASPQHLQAQRAKPILPAGGAPLLQHAWMPCWLPWPPWPPWPPLPPWLPPSLVTPAPRIVPPVIHRRCAKTHNLHRSIRIAHNLMHNVPRSLRCCALPLPRTPPPISALQPSSVLGNITHPVHLARQPTPTYLVPAQLRTYMLSATFSLNLGLHPPVPGLQNMSYRRNPLALY